MQASTYHRASRLLLAQANEELAVGDSRQASEKGWGAAAQIVKAVAAQRGWVHNTHSGLYDVVARLVEETGDNDISIMFHVASSLHVNFYENWQPGLLVEEGLRQMDRFLDRIEPLLERGPSG